MKARPQSWSLNGQQLWERIQQLLPEAEQRVTRQHVVSQVVLRRFTEPGPGGWQLLPFDLRYPNRLHKRKGTRACGWIEDFVPFASASLEQVWNDTETRLKATFEAVDAHTVFQEPDYVQTLRDLLALHWVRSLRYLALHHQTFHEVFHRHRAALLANRGLLEAAAAEAHTMYPAGPQGRELIADKLMQLSLDAYTSGALLRARIEEMFHKARAFIAQAGIEIVSPEHGEFLIGDTPALTLRHGEGPLQWGMALGDATTVVLPIGPHHLIALGHEHKFFRVPSDLVERINTLQILTAHRHVFMRPHSGLQRFVRMTLEADPN